MNRDDIVRMAREVAGVTYPDGTTGVKIGMSEEHLERFAKLVAAAEREACAQIAHDTYEGFGPHAKGVDFVKQHIAIRIRERGAP
jgi:hypothetical protein